MLASLSTTPLASFLGSSAPPIPGGAKSRARNILLSPTCSETTATQNVTRWPDPLAAHVARARSRPQRR